VKSIEVLERNLSQRSCASSVASLLNKSLHISSFEILEEIPEDQAIREAERYNEDSLSIILQDTVDIKNLTPQKRLNTISDENLSRKKAKKK
jgi:hypothetical protein